MTKKRAKLRKSAQQKVKHKPNARHTLNEVLHSLQDLMHNELAEITDDQTKNSSAETTVPRTKEEVLKSLQALIGKSKNKSASNDNTEIDLPIDTRLDQVPDESTPDDWLSEDEVAQTGLEIETETATTGTDGVQDDFPTPPPADEFRLEMEELQEFESRVENKPVEKKVSEHSRKKTINPVKHGKGEQVEIAWDDIPVLNEVVAPPPEPGSATTQEAREIAIKVAAMLNIEARKKGGESTLDVRTIMRLQSLLSQELLERQDDDSEPGEADTGNGAKDASGDDDA